MMREKFYKIFTVIIKNFLDFLVFLCFTFILGKVTDLFTKIINIYKNYPLFLEKVNLINLKFNALFFSQKVQAEEIQSLIEFGLNQQEAIQHTFFISMVVVGGIGMLWSGAHLLGDLFPTPDSIDPDNFKNFYKYFFVVNKGILDVVKVIVKGGVVFKTQKSIEKEQFDDK